MIKIKQKYQQIDLRELLKPQFEAMILLQQQEVENFISGITLYWRQSAALAGKEAAMFQMQTVNTKKSFFMYFNVKQIC